jgi:predicted nucleic acid-binding Zn ribbon protein
MNNYCYNCGKPLEQNAITCSECGAPIKNSHEKRRLNISKYDRMNFTLALLITITFTLFLSSHSALAETVWFQDYTSFILGFILTLILLGYSLFVLIKTSFAFQKHEISDQTRLISIFLCTISLLPLYFIIEAFVWY